MPGPPPPGTPPEVPEEFAAAYRAAYEAALEAQSVPVKQGEHAARWSSDVETTGEDELDLPERTRAIRIGTHRSERQESTSARRWSDSAWFVPLLLVLLALLLVVGAYVLGRAFAHRVSGHEGQDAKPRVTVRLASL